MPTQNDLSYCSALVRRLDRDRYLCALFAPDDRRENLLALYAFNLELARVPELVREPILGQVRLQWWREALDSVFGDAPPAHQVAAALAETVKSRRLDRAGFDRMLAAREFDLDPAPPEDMAALEAYVDATAGALGRLALDVLGAESSAEPAAASARDVGMAWGLTGLIRAVPFHARMGRVYLPKSLLEREGVGIEDVLAARTSPGLSCVTRAVAARAREFLESARGRPLPRTARAALLPAVLADADLRRLERAGFDPFSPRLEGGALGRRLRVLLAATRGRL